MPRVNKEALTDLKIRRLNKPGRYSDGRGLYLVVGQGDARYWVFRYTRDGKKTDLGLGSFHGVSLSRAREKARELHRLLADGVDPAAAKREQRIKARADAARSITFEKFAAGHIAKHKAGWRNEKHAAQWEATLKQYVYPVFGRASVSDIGTADVLKVFEQPVDDGTLWTKRPETASRVRGRIETILNAAAASGLRDGDNPARWRGHLQFKLAAQPLSGRVKHFDALPYEEMPAFVANLRARQGSSARALEFLVYTAARSGEVRGMTWGEVDLHARLWTIPGERMKARRKHESPLSNAAMALLLAMRVGEPAEDQLVFPGIRGGKLSDMSLTAVLRRMGVEATAHGARSTFRDWAGDCTEFPREVAEAQLAHVLSDKTEAAYRRSNALEKRRRLMDAWATYLATPNAAGGANGGEQEQGG